MVKVNVFAQEGQGFAASADSYTGLSHWLQIKQGDTEVVLFGSAGQMEAFRMVADILNDAFRGERPAEQVERPGAAVSLSDVAI